MNFLEDFPIGVRRELGTFAVNESDVIRFATEFDPQPFHVDPDAAKASFYGGIIASGWHTASMTMRVVVDKHLAASASLGSPGVDELRWLKPVRPGDTLTVFTTVEEIILSKSKPDRGFLCGLTEVENQAGDVVMSMRAKTMMKRRAPAGVGQPAE